MNNNEPNLNAFTDVNPNDDFVATKPPKKPSKMSRKWKIIGAAIAIFVFIFGIIPATVYIRASNNNPDIPIENFEMMSQFQFENEVANSIVILEQNPILEEFTFRESLINQYIYNFVRVNVNSLYNPTSQCELDQCRYLYSEVDENDELLIGVKAVWVEFTGGQMFINVAIDYNDIITISTVARFEAEINFNIDRLELEIVDFKLDNFNVPNFVLNQIKDSLASNLVVQLPESFAEYVTIDLANLNATLRQSDLRYVLDTVPARIESIQIVDGGMIILIRYNR